MRKNAFTLAEVLVTLAVIGVVAALTIPSLMQKWTEKAYKAKYKKFFSEISQFHKKCQGENLIPFTKPEDYRLAFEDTFKYSKRCFSNASTDGCWHKSGEWKTINGVGLSDINSFAYILADGMLVVPGYQSYSSAPNGFYRNNVQEVLVDVNGFKGPNRTGIDIFGALLMKDRALPSGGWESFYYVDSFCVRNKSEAYAEYGTSCSINVILDKDY